MTSSRRAILGLRVGDVVEVRAAEEIIASLDERGELDHMPFMPEMLRFTGRQFRVRGVAHKTCDTIHNSGGRKLEHTVHLEDLRCDGSAHAGCQARCLLFWKEAWLRRAPESRPEAPPGQSERLCITLEDLQAQTQKAQNEGDLEPAYRCQATELLRATRPLPWWDPRQYWRDWRSGNVDLKRILSALCFRVFRGVLQARWLRGYSLLLSLYDRFQRARGGSPYPFREGRLTKKTPSASLDLQPGEWIRVKPLDAICETLDVRNRNRGLAWDVEMVPFCGKRLQVLDRVERIIDEKTGRMVQLPNACLILAGAVCGSRYSHGRYFCPRAIFSYWREIWVERDCAPPASVSSPPSD